VYGRPATVAGSSPQIASVPTQSAQSTPRSSGPVQSVPWVLVGLVVLFFVWAMVEHHHARLRDELKPQAIAINLRNLAVIMLPVVIGINVLKIAAAKWKAAGLPAGDLVVALLGNL